MSTDEPTTGRWPRNACGDELVAANRRRLTEVLETQSLAVLATAGEPPHLSLVAIDADDDGRRIVFSTPRATRKYARIGQDDRVALLLDSRGASPVDFSRTVAVTARGRAREVVDDERERLAAGYVRRHPHLAEFVTAPTCALFVVDVDEYDVVSNFQNVVRLEIVR